MLTYRFHGPVTKATALGTPAVKYLMPTGRIPPLHICLPFPLSLPRKEKILCFACKVHKLCQIFQTGDGHCFLKSVLLLLWILCTIKYAFYGNEKRDGESTVSSNPELGIWQSSLTQNNETIL